MCGDIRRDERSVSSFCSVACRFNRLSDWEGVFVEICSFEGGNGGVGVCSWGFDCFVFGWNFLWICSI